MLLSVSKWREILRGKTEPKSAPKTISSGNGNGLKNFVSTREQKNVHTVYVKQDCVCERIRHRLWGTVGYLQQYNNGTPQGNSMEQWYPAREIL